MSEAMQKSFTAVFDCEARAVGKMRSEMTVHWREPKQMSWEMASDETGFQGGDGTAPVPMAYFMAGLTSCLMTQVRAFAKKMRIDVRDAVVNCHAEWEATVEGRDPYVAAPKGVRMDIELTATHRWKIDCGSSKPRKRDVSSRRSYANRPLSRIA